MTNQEQLEEKKLVEAIQSMYASNIALRKHNDELYASRLTYISKLEEAQKELERLSVLIDAFEDFVEKAEELYPEEMDRVHKEWERKMKKHGSK